MFKEKFNMINKVPQSKNTSYKTRHKQAPEWKNNNTNGKNHNYLYPF